MNERIRKRIFRKAGQSGCLRFDFKLGACFLAFIMTLIYMPLGCTSEQNGIYINETIWVYATNRVGQAIDKHSPVPDAATGDDPVQEVPGGSMGTPSGSGAPSGTGDSSLTLDFKYGGFKAKNPQEDSRCQLGSPKITKDKISYKWLTKIPSDWKRQDTKKGPMVIAAAFYWDGSKWVGGKTDFCDESRSSRSATNIHEGYNGWNASAWDSAKKRAFCVVSADGKWRSNLIED